LASANSKPKRCRGWYADGWVWKHGSAEYLAGYVDEDDLGRIGTFAITAAAHASRRGANPHDASSWSSMKRT
jgi:hypothetical protein